MSAADIKQTVTVSLAFLLLMIAVTFYICSFDVFKNYSLLCWLANALFTVHAIVLYIILRISSKSTNRQRFLNVTLANTLVKMVISVVFLILYKILMKPPDGKFVFPFIIIYVMYTIFETYFMLNLAELKPKVISHEPKQL